MIKKQAVKWTHPHSHGKESATWPVYGCHQSAETKWPLYIVNTPSYCLAASCCNCKRINSSKWFSNFLEEIYPLHWGTPLPFLTHSQGFLFLCLWLCHLIDNPVFRCKKHTSPYSWICRSIVLELTHKSSAIQGTLNLAFKSISSCSLLMWHAGLPGVPLQTTQTLPCFSWRTDLAMLTKLSNSSGIHVSESRVIMCFWTS